MYIFQLLIVKVIMLSIILRAVSINNDIYLFYYKQVLWRLASFFFGSTLHSCTYWLRYQRCRTHTHAQSHNGRYKEWFLFLHICTYIHVYMLIKYYIGICTCVYIQSKVHSLVSQEDAHRLQFYPFVCK